MKVTIDREECISCGVCWDECPEFFEQNDEDEWSHVWKVEHVVIVGTVSNICVLHTAASAGLRWYHIVMPANGISAQTEFDQALTLHQVSSLYAGDVIKSVDDIQFGP